MHFQHAVKAKVVILYQAPHLVEKVYSELASPDRREFFGRFMIDRYLCPILPTHLKGVKSDFVEMQTKPIINEVL